jgi:hypothetical protein
MTDEAWEAIPPAKTCSKCCSKCGLSKPTSEFWKDATKPDGLYSSCRDCESGLVPDGFGGEATSPRRQRNAERARQRIAERKAAGLCTQCGHVPPLSGQTRCADCAEKHRTHSPEVRERRKEADRERYLERTALRLCQHCDRPARPGRTECEACAQRSAK